jgi:hypothetical protein
MLLLRSSIKTFAAAVSFRDGNGNTCIHHDTNFSQLGSLRNNPRIAHIPAADENIIAGSPPGGDAYIHARMQVDDCGRSRSEK